MTLSLQPECLDEQHHFGEHVEHLDPSGVAVCAGDSADNGAMSRCMETFTIDNHTSNGRCPIANPRGGGPRAASRS
jgi:hypothetical protein